MKRTHVPVAPQVVVPKKKRLGSLGRRASVPVNSFSTARLVGDLGHYQTELEIQNKALRFSQAAAESAYERFVTLFSTVPLALMVVDDNGQILENNTRALALLRPVESDRPLTYLPPLIRTDHLDKMVQGFAMARQNGSCELSELAFDGGSNGTIIGDLHIARIDRDQEASITYICAIIDQGPLLAQRSALQTSAVTLQQRNNELQLSQARLAAIINSSLDAIICVDPNQRILVFNPTAAHLFRCAANQALGMALADFLPGAVPALTHVPASGHVQLGELSGINHEGGTVALEVSLSFEQHPQGAIVTLFAHDLTSRKKMESQRAALESQLRESQKMQAIGTMAGGIAHDFNNIISAILGNVELARGDIRADTPAAISLTEIDKAGRRARDLVRQILAFSRHEPPRRLALQLADVVLETVRLLKVTLPPQVQLLLDLDPHTPPILADATQIQQVLLNLCTNAIQAIGKSSGTVRLELRRCQVDHAPGTASHSPLTGESICLTVSDTGPGMSDVVLQRVFEPFFTTKPVGQGTGLGLSVVHGIMRTHQGSVQAVSTPGKGSSFTLFFPASPVALTVSPTTEETAMPAISEQAGSGQRVMYVDDDEALVFLVKRLLTRQGYAVTTHTDPRLALAAVRADPTHWHLVVTDFNMPGYSGIDLIRAIKAVRPELPVALASGYVTPEIERDALVAGANALIHKPNDVDELCGIVQKLLAKSDGDNSIG